MSRYRGFTVSCNAIGAGRLLRKYLVLATKEMLEPLLVPANRNMIEAKSSCQITINTRSLFRRGAMDTWIKYQIVQVVAPSQAKHLQAKRLMESLLPGSTDLKEYKDTARTRMQNHEFVPDNKKLVFGLHRTGIMHYKYGEVEDLDSPNAPAVSKFSNKPLIMPWKITKREKRGVALPTRVFPLERTLNINRLLQMLVMKQNYKLPELDPEEGGNANNMNNISRKAPHGFYDNPDTYANNQRYSLQSPPPAFGLV